MRVTAKKLILAAVVLLLCAASLLSPALADGNRSGINRFNVVMVLDASGSMDDTDKAGLRYEAIGEFVNLLTEKGNCLGSVIFSDGVRQTQSITPADSIEDKQSFVDALRAEAPYGYTNLGAALDTAVDMINADADKELPSVIVFLSDGNTEMSSPDGLQKSLDRKADAIEKARDSGIPIYTVCLNDETNTQTPADVTEMRQISEATGGVFREVRNASDLQDIFDTFYALIYGTATVVLFDDVYPPGGEVRTQFDVPGAGVEEVNIVIRGRVQSASLTDPDGTPAEPHTVSSALYTLIKMTDITPGTWTLITRGVPGERIRINMVCNTDLGVSIETVPDANALAAGSTLTVRARLTGEDIVGAEQYAGYEAFLHILDAYGNELDCVEMELGGDCFETVLSPGAGVYRLYAQVCGYYLDKVSEMLGPLTVGAGSDLPTGNEAPQPVRDTVRKTVYIWPFTEKKELSVDMRELAGDREDSELRYQIVSSSFLEGEDYSVSGDVITLHGFSLSRGSFEISATDSGGLSCRVDVKIRCVYVGILAAALLALALLALLTLLIRKLRMPFRGTVTVYCVRDGYEQPCGSIYRTRGRIRLSEFAIPGSWPDADRSYIRAGGRYVELVCPKKVSNRGTMTKRVRVMSGRKEYVFPTQENALPLVIEYAYGRVGSSGVVYGK